MHMKDDTLSVPMHSHYIKILSLKSLLLIFEFVILDFTFWFFESVNLSSKSLIKYIIVILSLKYLDLKFD